jgi:UDP-N-acetylglucosamine 2-epimerase (non-hydrolysing)
MLLEPLDYLSFVNLLKRATLVLTDSGGVQEEAPSFGVPVLIARETTERPEGIQAGVAKLVGTSRDKITAEVSRLLSDPNVRRRMVKSTNPYGDGQAAHRIATALIRNEAGSRPAAMAHPERPLQKSWSHGDESIEAR